MWLNFRKPLIYAQQYFYAMSKIHKLQNKILQDFIVLLVSKLTLQWWASMCLPVHKEFKNPYFISILRVNLQVTDVCLCCGDKGIYNNFFQWICWTPLHHHFGKKLYTLVPWWMHKTIANKMSKESTLYTSAFKSYDAHVEYFLDAFCTYWFICIPWSLLLHLPYHITYEAKTLPVHSSAPANNNKAIKWILLNVHIHMLWYLEILPKLLNKDLKSCIGFFQVVDSITTWISNFSTGDLSLLTT